MVFGLFALISLLSCLLSAVHNFPLSPRSKQADHLLRGLNSFSGYQHKASSPPGKRDEPISHCWSSLNSTRIPALDKSSHKLPVSCSNLTKVNSQTQGFGISQASINVSAPLIMTNDSTASSFSQYNQSTSNSTYVYAVQSAISSELARASSSPSMISDTFGLNDTTNGTSMFPSGNMTQYSDNSSTSQNYQPKSSTCTDLMRIFCQEAQGSKPPQYCLTICAASLPANTSALNSTYGSPLASSNPRPQGPAKDQPNAPGSQKPNTNAIKGWTWSY